VVVVDKGRGGDSGLDGGSNDGGGRWMRNA
jgi:hypothetical protein